MKFFIYLSPFIFLLLLAVIIIERNNFLFFTLIIILIKMSLEAECSMYDMIHVCIDAQELMRAKGLKERQT